MKNPASAAVRVALLSILLASLSPAFANTYYVSSSTGNDSYSSQQAQRPATPWRSLARLAQVISSFQPGDSILFLRNDVFAGSLPVTASGLVFSAYGSGADPVISGLSTLSGWTSAGANIWEASLPTANARVGVVLVNGVEQRIGRYPNATAANGGYRTIGSYSANISITDNDLSGSPDWTGGEVVIRKNRWVLDRNTITRQSGNTITYSSESGYYASNGYGYFIQNHPATLDLPGEWYYKSASRRLGIYASGSPAGIQASTVEILVSVNGQSHLSFDHITFTGANTNAFDIKNASDIRISNCTVLHTGNNAIDAAATSGLVIENSTIDYTHNNACNADNCPGLVIRNTAIRRTGIFAGMGRGDSGSYEAILASGDNQTIERNTIDSTGYSAITFRGNAVSIKNNVIAGYAFVKDDGSGIYTWNNLPNAPVAYGRSVSGNIVRSGRGAPEGTDAPGKTFAHGIYLDDNTAGVEVSNNTVADCAGFGLYVHNARDNTITGNTLYNNQVQLSMIHDDIAPNCPVSNNTVTGNIFFSLQAAQPVAEYKTSRDDLAGFGSFDNNYYCRPLDDRAVINTLRQVNGNYIYLPLDLDGWKALYGKDGSSAKSPRTIAPYIINQITGANQFSNGAFPANINGLYAYSPANNCATSWNNGALDGGTLQVSFSNITGNSKGTVIIGIGAVTAGRKYLLRFSLKGPNEHRMLELYLRKSQSPYSDLTDRRLVPVAPARSENEYVFIPSESSSDASIGIDVPEQSQAVYFDNIRLTEVSATAVNPTDSIRLLVNTTAAAQASALDNNYVDVTNTVYSGTVTLGAYSSKVFLAAPAGAAVTVGVPAVCSATGSILREQWSNIDGNDVANIPLTSTPTSSSQLTSFEGPKDFAEKYGSRIRGYICPPQTGIYTFWIAGDDATELWLSTGSDPANKVKIAYSLSWTNYREWNKFATQKSAGIYLLAGQKYHIEALHKEGNGGDHVSVAWQLPDGTMEAPIAGSRLSPFVVAAVVVQSQTISFSAPAAIKLGQTSPVLSATATSGLDVRFSIVSGPATLSGNTLTPTAAGIVIVKASQAGNANYSAAPDVVQTILVTAPVVCTASGSILREVWSGIGGNDIAYIPLSNAPASSGQLTSFEGPRDAADYYGSRIRGYICPPQSGNYTFWIAGDDATELWLSTNSDPASKVKIAYSQSWTNYREWNKFATQKSATIYLQAGQKYYVEALHKEGNGGDHVSVAWQLPDGTMEAPIPGSRLSPYALVSTALIAQVISFGPLAPVTLGQGNVVLSAVASSGLPVSYTIVSGPATINGSILVPTGSGTVVVQAAQEGNILYSAASPVRQSLVVTAPAVCSATGSILRELWSNVDGNDVSSIPLASTPSATGQLTSFEGPKDFADKYGSRIRGYICVPQTGNYTFWIAGDDGTELWLSNSSDPNGKVKIAYSQSWTDYREWNKFASQKSATVYLQAGQKYYVEALQKEGNGGDHVSVAWQLPDGTMEAPMPGSRLSPYVAGSSTTAAVADGVLVTDLVDVRVLSVYPNPLNESATVQVTTTATGAATLSLYDLHGKLIRQLFSGDLYKDVPRQFRLDAERLSAGLYVVRLHTAAGDRECKVIVTK